MKVRIDRVKCKGYELCIAEAPVVFDIDDSSKAFVREEYAGNVPAELTDSVRQAAIMCPERAVLLDDDG